MIGKIKLHFLIYFFIKFFTNFQLLATNEGNVFNEKFFKFSAVFIESFVGVMLCFAITALITRSANNLPTIWSF